VQQALASSALQVQVQQQAQEERSPQQARWTMATATNQ
jgi:hypothetical protein